MYLYKAKFTLADLIGLFSLSIRPVTYFHVSKSHAVPRSSHPLPRTNFATASSIRYMLYIVLGSGGI